eukprot:908516-Pyramimonas_sp.AAC.1
MAGAWASARLPTRCQLRGARGGGATPAPTMRACSTSTMALTSAPNNWRPALRPWPTPKSRSCTTRPSKGPQR